MKFRPFIVRWSILGSLIFRYLFSVAYFVVREWLLCLMGRQIRMVVPADGLSVSRDRLLLLRGFHHTKSVTEWSGIPSGKPVPVTTEWMNESWFIFRWKCGSRFLLSGRCRVPRRDYVSHPSGQCRNTCDGQFNPRLVCWKRRQFS